MNSIKGSFESGLGSHICNKCGSTGPFTPERINGEMDIRCARCQGKGSDYRGFGFFLPKNSGMHSDKVIVFIQATRGAYGQTMEEALKAAQAEVDSFYKDYDAQRSKHTD